MEHDEHIAIQVTGIVQGVGMRPFVYRQATTHGVCGWVLNASDGVHIHAHATPQILQAFVDALSSQAPAAARIDSIGTRKLSSDEWSAEELDAFTIHASHETNEKTTLVSPDLATCPDCLRELFNPADRRFHYPFINCTNCGPRYTIIRDLPYDRRATSMDVFPMCPSCASEYADPLDRRFHAQPDACFSCGPHLTWRTKTSPQKVLVGDTQSTSDQIIQRCVSLLAQGLVVAIKGLGGFHLVCNAQSSDAVALLRTRKHRPSKPLALMARDLSVVQTICEVSQQAKDLLCDPAHPIVLLPRKHQSYQVLSSDVALNMPELGIMLPYTPLQHLLLQEAQRCGIDFLVMTSANISGEPIEIDDKSAWTRLVEGDIADALLGNNRAILTRYDDSVVRPVAHGAQIIRRARGFAPRPLGLPSGARNVPCILACGAEQKSVLAFTREDPTGAACFLSQHLGDTEHAETFHAWHETRMRMQELFDVEPRVLVCDKHPSYLTAQWARQTARQHNLVLLEVQHHHAHIAATLADAAVQGVIKPQATVVGIAFDGTGAGDDQTVWGGEILLANLTTYQRKAHLRPWRLAGGAASIRDARRGAWGLLCSFGLDTHPGAARLQAELGSSATELIAQMVDQGINSPYTSSVGRLLDAFAALLGICGEAGYEGEPAIKLEARAAQISEPCACRGQGLACDTKADIVILDPEPLLQDVLNGIQAHVSQAVLARYVHEALAQATAYTTSAICEEVGIKDVALGGGVFMNQILQERITSLLNARQLNVLVPLHVPLNDGGIAYGQAAIAHARLADFPHGS